MSRNVIDIFARGNQELFHSAFLAWLMDDHESHGLGKSFRSRIISRLREDCGYDPNGEYEVATEYRSGRSRFDIILRPIGSARQGEGLLFENKIKNFGSHLQLDKYKGEGYYVAVLALLPETLDEDTKQHYQVLTYETIRDVLNEVSLHSEDPHQFLVIQYRSFLERTLATYSAIADYCSGTVESDGFFERLGRAVEGLTFGDNDIRTFNYFYYYRLAEFIKSFTPDLAFGNCAYDEAEKRKANTRWLFEKNMQGPPFMEAIIYQPFNTAGWTLHSSFRAIHERNPLQIAPRVQIWLDLPALVGERRMSEQIGVLMLGTWNSEFKTTVKQLEPYRKTLKPKPRADRHFHCEPVQVSDLPFSQMTQRIRGMMRLIFE